MSSSDVTDGESENCDLFAPDPEIHGPLEGAVEHDQLVQHEKGLLINPNEEDYAKLLQWFGKRLSDGSGEVLYEIGVQDGCSNGLSKDDLKQSVDTLEKLAADLGADILLLQEKEQEVGCTAEYLVRLRVEEEDFCEVRVAVVGNVDAGKSTLLGVLTHGQLDDGRGTARLKLFRHKHEAESGRTSSVGNDILGFDSKGTIVNRPDPHSGSLDWQRICRDSSKVITFIDLAGHEKYLKTTVFGMTGHAPDFAMLMIGSNMGVVGMTKEHLGLALALNVPVFVVVTKIDMCPTNVLQDTMKILSRILKSPGCRKIPVIVSSEDDVIVSANNFMSERICPIFQVSNVTGHNLPLLKMFLNLLSVKSNFDKNEPAIFQIDDTYSVPGVGTVVSGTALQGTIYLNEVLSLGPDSLGHFQQVPVKSIHRKRLPVKVLRAGQTASFALKKVKRQEIRKGMVMVSKSLEPRATWEFEAEVLVLHHPTTISPKYQAMVHCGSLRQTATILSMDREHLRTGDRANCHFRFIKNPEFVQIGTKMIFREGRTKAVGTITKLLNDVEYRQSQSSRTGKVHKAQMHQRAQQANRGRTTRQGQTTAKPTQSPPKAQPDRTTKLPPSTSTTAATTPLAINTEQNQGRQT